MNFRTKVLIIVALVAAAHGAPALDATDDFDGLSVVPLSTTEFGNDSTPQDLYVIKAVVYEIGILTDVDENDTSSNETIKNEQLDFTFFNPDHNGSIIDLGNIPIPIQTNITGQVITGFAPVDLGTINSTVLSSEGVSASDLPFSESLQHLLGTIIISDENQNNVTEKSNENYATINIPSIPTDKNYKSVKINLSSPSQTKDEKTDVIHPDPLVLFNSTFSSVPLEIHNV